MDDGRRGAGRSGSAVLCAKSALPMQCSGGTTVELDRATGGVVGRCVDVATYSNAERAQAPRLSEQTGVSRARE